MNELRDSLKHFEGLRFVVDALELSSAPGRRMLLATSWAADVRRVEERIVDVAAMVELLENPATARPIEEIALLLCALRIVVGSIETLMSGAICSDIDFFELKGLALLEGKVRREADRNTLQLKPMPSLKAVVELLDPEGHRLEPFYLSDSYSETLAALRKRQEAATDDDERTAIAQLAAAEEERVRKHLGKQLRPYADDLLSAYNALSQDDILIAKAKWALLNRAVRPVPLSEGESSLRELWHPTVAASLEERGEHFQPVSVSFGAYPTLITGANMAGKSVFLSSVALAQVMMQYGFFVPASEARLVVVQNVMTSMTDGQDTGKGLSSYAAEILRLNEMILEAKQHRPLLLLIDEAARTTNPEEGRAIVEGLVTLFGKYRTRAIITTHYSGIKAEASRLRVKGFIEERVRRPLEVNSLNKCIDYQLVPVDGDEAPQEAIRIAEILGVDTELIDYSKGSIALHNERSG